DSKINWDKRKEGRHKILLQWHEELIRLRKTLSVLKNFEKKDIQVQVLGEDGFVLLRQTAGEEERMICLFNLSDKELSYQIPSVIKEGQKILDSNEGKWRMEKEKVMGGHPAAIEAGQPFSLMPNSVAVYLDMLKEG
ncbi:MAG: DUF3459 domain-containing protein, partial [Flavisolibacter sp.]|nr:DUF3459 domain-containing protein [Flavisolibacter sp.]